MIDNINKLSKSVDTHKQQATAASIVNLTDDDVVKIWDNVSAFIESYLKQSKGVSIPGFGTFTFIHKKIDVGNNKFLLIQRPVLSFSEKFCQTHNLKFTHYPVNGAIPVHPLNYFHIQSQSNYSRDQIEQCVKHVLQIFNRSVAAQRNVEFTFSRIGKLQIREGKVKMRFFKDFIESVDGAGGKHQIEAATCNRPQTSDSVMTEREAARPPTASNVVLPRLNSRIGNPAMQSIQEEPNIGEEENPQRSASIKQRNQQRVNLDLSITNSDLNYVQTRSSEFKLPSLIDSAREFSATISTNPPALNESSIPIATLFSSSDLPQPNDTSRKSSPNSSVRRAASFHHGETEKDPNSAHEEKARIIFRATSDATAALGLTRPTTDRSARDRISSSLHVTIPTYHPNVSSSIAKPITPCGHHGAGQELCYLCHQRAKRNVPVYLHEEKRIREAEESKLLEQYQHNRDLDEKRKQEAAFQADREEKQRIAAFNLGVAEAMRAKKMERPKTSDIPRSFVFRKRARTPPTYVRQQDLAKQLDAQIKWKQDEQRLERQEKDFVERIEQIQLAEALSQERETYLRNKRLHQEEMKSALDHQVKTKPSGIPPMEPAAQYFGTNDMSTEKLQERRQQAMEIFRQQKQVVEQRQRQQLLKQMREQEYESKALESMKDDLLSDRRERFRRAFTIRKDLETDWANAVDEKRNRDDDERKHVYAPQGVLVHEQCDQYRRCAQCQRNVNNYGASNIWKDTRYVPGSRIMV